MKLFGGKTEYHGEIADIHSHILYEVDDGSHSLNQSKRMLDIAAEEGITVIFCTPHFLPERRNATREETAEKRAVLTQYIAEKGYNLTLKSGNEIYYHHEVCDALDRDEINPLGDSDYVLVEFSPVDDARKICNGLMEIQNMGFGVICAHVERYASMLHKPYDEICRLRQAGIFIQVNAGSILGNYGKEAQKACLDMIKKGLVDFVATDAHSEGSRAPRMKECATLLTKKFGVECCKRLLYENAKRYLM